MDGEHASSQDEPPTRSLARSMALPPEASVSSSLPPSSMPEPSIASTFASSTQIPPQPSSSTRGRALRSFFSSASNRLNPHCGSNNLGHENTTHIPPAGILEVQDRARHDQRAPCDDLSGAPDTVRVDNMLRQVKIIISGDKEESTRRATMLIDSGAQVNCISRRLVDRLGLAPTRTNLSFLTLILRILAPWTKTAKMAEKQAKNRISGFDGRSLPGQSGIVKLSWYGENPSGLSDPLVWFRPIRYETEHVIVDGDCAAELVLAWNEIPRLRLRHRFISPIQRPPTPEPDPGNKLYEEYERRKAQKKAKQDEKRRNDRGQHSSSTVRANEPHT